MYHHYFGLAESPFSIAVNPRYLFMSARHRDALAHLLYGVGSGGGFILLTGEVGTGKTTLNRCLLEQLPESTDIAIVLNPALSAVELLATVCDEFAIDYPKGADSLKVLTDALHGFLLANHEAGKRTVLMIDEAQHLHFDVLEQIRLLTNLETDEKKLLQIILIGQPELSAMLARPELRQLNQRITARFDLTPLDQRETHTYVRHRLQVAGLSSTRQVFSDGALRQVYRASGGTPRLINLVCDRAMTGAYGRNESSVSAAIVRQAAREVLGDTGRDANRPAVGSLNRVFRERVWLVVVVAVALALLVAMGPDRLLESLPAAALFDADSEAPPSTTADTPARAGASPPWMVSAEQADRALWLLWSRAPLTGSLCESAAGVALSCESARADTWDALRELNRPAVLELRRESGFAAAAVLVAITADVARLWNGRAVCVASPTQLAAAWTGRYHYLWRSPMGWAGPTMLGDQGPVIAHVVSQFARLDGLDAPPLDVFTEGLELRVRAFQIDAGLEVDGVIGLRTLQALEDALGEGFSAEAALRRATSLAGGVSCP